MEKQIRIKELHCGKVVDVIYSKGSPGYTLEEIAKIREKGSDVNKFQYAPPLDCRTFECAPDVICQRDMSMKVRDGVTLYFDLYLPKEAYENAKPVPLIIAWSMYGKRQSEGMKVWKTEGCPIDSVSMSCKFEASDPEYWCYYGYAVANVDVRGVNNSEGNVSPWGKQDAQDGYDFIEWAAEQPWCTGKVALFGNSSLAMCQWRIAAEQPPHLTCIAPWEGTGDLYREWLCPGGVLSPKFLTGIVKNISCSAYLEDLPAMYDEHPYLDEYWKTRIPEYEKITVPAYVCAGWCHFHLRGSVEGFRKITSPKKWLRIHREFEWTDAYSPENLDDLRRFFDRYLKNIHNGWEFTPTIRLDVMDAKDFDMIHNRPEYEFPLARTEYQKLYLNASNLKGEDTLPENHSEVTYQAQNEQVRFQYTFKEDTELTGFFKLHLWVESRGHDNIDLFVWLKKYNEDQEYIPIVCKNKEPGGDYRGAWGYMRASRRELDEAASTEYMPVQLHQRDLRLAPGEIVPVEIEIWPHSRFFHKGEVLSIEICGRWIESDWFEDHKFGYVTDNGDATHVIHTGGEYDSYLQIPVVPPRYKSGDFLIR